MLSIPRRRDGTPLKIKDRDHSQLFQNFHLLSISPEMLIFDLLNIPFAEMGNY